jgi:hypothetical protein
MAKRETRSGSAMSERPVRITLKLDREISDKGRTGTKFYDLLVNGQKTRTYIHVYRGSIYFNAGIHLSDSRRKKRDLMLLEVSTV